jgi:uncharacterized protein (TIGR03083 family)
VRFGVIAIYHRMARRCDRSWRTMKTSYIDDVTTALARECGRVTTLVVGAPDATVRIPNCPEWNVQQLASHLVTVARRYSEGPEGRGTWVEDPREVADLNDRQLRELDDRPLSELAGRLEDEVRSASERVRGYGGRMPEFRFHGGATVPADLALGALLGELIIHGWDLAQMRNRPWGIDARHAALVLEGLSAVAPGWIDRDRARAFTATFDVRLRGQTRQTWLFVDGRLSVHRSPHRGRVDCHISADPGALLLVFYGRESQWKHIARGKLVAWGRRPWLAFTVAARFHKP